jgi:hypothetical protein
MLGPFKECRFMFEWWAGLNPTAKYGVSFLFLGISTVLWLRGVFWPWGWAVGGVLLLFSLGSKGGGSASDF